MTIHRLHGKNTLPVRASWRRGRSTFILRRGERARSTKPLSPLSFLFSSQKREHVILSAAGAKDLLLVAPEKQVLRCARVPRASLRMTGCLLRPTKRKKRGEESIAFPAAQPAAPQSAPVPV